MTDMNDAEQIRMNGAWDPAYDENTGVMMKADRRGRVRDSPEQKQTLIEAFETIWLSAPRFTALHGVDYQTMVSRLKKRRDGSGDHPAYGVCKGARKLNASACRS